MGLKDTQHIARIVIHPARPDTVYVAALGHQPVRVTVADASGKVVRTLTGPQKAGIHRVSSEPFGFGGGGRRGGQANAAIPPGEYVVTLETGGVKLTQKARILETPTFP